MLGWWRRRRQARVREAPFPPEWDRILDRNLPALARLAPEDRDELRGLVAVFLDEKHFEGCGGLVVDDEVRVTIAGSACRLLVNRDDDPYPGLDVVRVYPSAFVVPARRREGLLVHEGDEVRTGESWQRGVVVLAWDAVLRGARHPGDGHDVALHEFAHQLDTADGAADGAPVLADADAYRAWARALGEAYAELAADVARGRQRLLDAYGATSPAEFFAVATEVFFEKPRRLRREEPELYAALRDFYRQDPAADGGRAEGSGGPGGVG